MTNYQSLLAQRGKAEEKQEGKAHMQAIRIVKKWQIKKKKKGKKKSYN